MKKFEDFKELLKELGIEFSSEVKYFNDELKIFLEGVGSDIVEAEEDEPVSSFNVKIENRTIEIGVTSIEVEEDTFKNYYWLVDIDYVKTAIDKDLRDNLMKVVKGLEEKYNDLKHNINIEKAQGSLSRLCNLNTEFDETFDQFFDNEDLRKKYNDWDYEENCIKLEKTADDLLEEFDEKDLRSYIDFYKNYIDELEDELKELKA